jgi:hypothetical protein
MDGQPQTSFIPKRDFNAAVEPERLTVSVFSIVAVTLFTISVTLSVGVFIYQKILVRQVNEMNANLVKTKTAYEPDFISQVTALDKQIQAVKGVLGSHVAPSRIFDLLGQDTLASVGFSSFSYQLDPKGSVDISGIGIATSFSAVALQSDVFSNEKFLKDVLFNDFNLDSSGNVTFHFKASVEPSFILYKSTFSGAESGTSTPTSSSAPNGGDSDNLDQGIEL